MERIMAKYLKTNLLSDSIINILRKFMIFDNLNAGDIKKILGMEAEAYKSRIARLCQFKAGETVIKEGEFDSWSFWVVKGSFDVIQGGSTLTTFSKSGEIFGEMSVLDGIPRTASVISRTDSVCLGIDMSVLDNMVDKNIRETIKKGFYNVILARIKETKDRMFKEKQRLEIQYADLVNFEKQIRSKKGT